MILLGFFSVQQRVVSGFKNEVYFAQAGSVDMI